MVTLRIILEPSNLSNHRVRLAAALADRSAIEREYFLFRVHQAYDVSCDGERFLMIRRRASDVRELIVARDFAEELKRLVPR
jgi:hypothetical protein